MQIGFVGLGTMGLPMARNLLRAGHAVRGFDTNPAARAAFAEAGGAPAESAAASARGAEAVVTMLPDDAIVRGVLAGEGGLLAAMAPGSVLVEMSTTGPATKQAMAQAAAAGGITLLDCPVGRTVDHAVAGTLAIMAAGDTAAIERMRPLFDAMGEHVFVCGPVGAASAMKLINNALAAAVNAATIEALVAGNKAGLSLETMFAVFRTTAAWSNALAANLPKKALKRDFKPGFMARLAHKDLGLAIGFAEEVGAEARFARAAHAVLAEALQDGYGAEDSAGSMLRAVERRSGVELPLMEKPPG
ncbi:NAD(P)-dependent oxidoreductase [Roseomonas sp. AR75]|uniref:NAD(P)-dependent oxidoreductase n=1 Tax=Roseomonas sp. AR75 TaxID=2562311 RepID=UPI0010C0374A|nr:NAD(P)-dependent oxidoreductase [Roseomonas sp. AR75]